MTEIHQWMALFPVNTSWQVPGQHLEHSIDMRNMETGTYNIISLGRLKFHVKY